MSTKKQNDYVVSVRLMTYNHEPFIEDALKGIDIQQTNFPFEIVVGDDFSTDKTLKKINDYQFFNSNINLNILIREKGDEYYENRKEKGRLYNFIDTINHCSGKYIALLDGDDYWTDPLKLQKQIDFLEENEEYGICFHKVSIMEQKTNKISMDYITREVLETTGIEELAKGNFIHTPSVVIRNNFLLPEWFSKAAIGDWTLYMIQIKNQKIKKLDDQMAVYRIHSAGIWAINSQENREKLTRENIRLVLKNGTWDTGVKNILKTRLKDYNKKPFSLGKIFGSIRK